MSAANTDLVRFTTPRFATNLADPVVDGTDTTITLDSVAGLATGTAVTLNLDETDLNGNLTPNLREVVTGVVNAGAGTLTNCLRGRDGTTAQAHATGANVVQWWDATIINDFMTAFLTQHTQAGAHQGLTTDTLLTTGNATIGGILAATSPKFTTGIKDANGNLMLAFSPTISAVNEVEVINGAAGSPATVAAIGSDTDVDIKLLGQGAGVPWLFGGIIKGLVAHRQGGNATDWSSPGSTNYDPSALKVLIQVGSATGSTGGDTTVTYPTAFSHPPVIVGAPSSAGAFNTFFLSVSPSSSSFSFRLLDTGGSRHAETCNWIAIGAA